MPSTCFECGVVVDALRTPGRVIGARVVSVCRDCAAGRTRPQVPTVTESIEAVGEVAPRAPARRPSRWPRRSAFLAAGAAAIAGACLSGWALRGALAHGRAQATRTPALRAEPPMVLPLVMPVVAAPRPAPARPRSAPALPSTMTVLPLEGAQRATPTPNGFFGALRPGERPGECGDGHCGVDLRAPEGTPVLAVRAGVVAAVNRDADGRGGRWVRLDHAGGVSSHYFHLDTIGEGIVPGARVEPGEVIATVGRTGVHLAPTHLHFAVTVGGVYVDPMKMMRAAL